MNYNGKVLDVIEEVKKVVVGKDICVAKIMASIIAGGNILMDDVPGVGKTTMALAFANAMGLENKRMQFTQINLCTDLGRLCAICFSPTKSTEHLRRHSRHCWR